MFINTLLVLLLINDLVYHIWSWRYKRKNPVPTYKSGDFIERIDGTCYKVLEASVVYRNYTTNIQYLVEFVPGKRMILQEYLIARAISKREYLDRNMKDFEEREGL